MKTSKLLILALGMTIALGACKTAKISSVPSTAYQTNVIATEDLQDLKYPLADSVMKYSMKGSADAILTNEMVNLSRQITDNMLDKVSVSQYGQGVVVSLNKGNVFGVDDYTLNEDTKTILRNLAYNLNENKESYIVVFGRADATGNAKHNQDLAYKRAASVANYLFGCAIDKNRLFVESFGEKYPDYANNSKLNMNKNRRVDLLIIPSNEIRESAGK
ncbi:MAG: OmpA family protein [Emticicia sp.]|uniref:OmpA family protein n=1 Tax=Emticicia sp. TaxID=1930953 RepID=UPI003BA49C17